MSQLTNVSASSDPVSAVFGSAFTAVPMLINVFVGALYVFLWVKFEDSPARYKLEGITTLVLLVSLLFAWAGFPFSALFNIIIWILVYFLTPYFKGV